MTASINLSACMQCHCLAARRTARALTRLYDKQLRPHGLRTTQFSVLVALATAGPMRVGALAAALGLERTTLTRSADLLERNGWVASEASDDGRERRMRLTKTGQRKLESAYPAWKTAQDSAETRIRKSSLTAATA